MNKLIYFSFIAASILLFFRDVPSETGKDFNNSGFLLGNESLIKNNSGLLKGKRIGVITNKSGVTSEGTLFLDVLNRSYTVTKIFSPEHGLRGDDREGNYTDDVSGINVISLYGSNKKPLAEDLEDVDVLVYDIQDVGARFYTYINTMLSCIESAAELNKEIIICDRPVIPDGNYTDGFILESDLHSPVGMINIPAAYAMTCGELANYINSEYFGNKCNLVISKMENYSHSSDYGSLNLPWIKPSPSIYFPTSAVAYLGTCLFEGTNFSEGRGTDKPFEYVGAPYCDGDKLASVMNSHNFSGVNFESITFIPSAITSPSNPPKYVGEKCGGVYINVNDRKTFEPFKTAVALLVNLNNLFPEFEIKKNNFIDKLAGSASLRVMIQNGNTSEEIINSYSSQLEDFKIKRKNFLLYN